MTAMPALPPSLQTLLTTSAYASLFALVILLLQPLLQRCISARWRFILWMLVLIRFLPLSLPESRFSIFNYLPRSTVTTMKSATPIFTTPTPILSAPMIVPSTPSPVESITRQPFTFALTITPTSSAPFPWLTSLYFLGTFLLFLRFLLASLSLHKILRHSTRITGPSLLATLHSAQQSLNLYKPIPLLQTNALSSPALVGMFRPRPPPPLPISSTLSPPTNSVKSSSTKPPTSVAATSHSTTSSPPSPCFTGSIPSFGSSSRGSKPTANSPAMNLSSNTPPTPSPTDTRCSRFSRQTPTPRRHSRWGSSIPKPSSKGEST